MIRRGSREDQDVEEHDRELPGPQDIFGVTQDDHMSEDLQGWCARHGRRVGGDGIEGRGTL